jgi:hypothetical protein
MTVKDIETLPEAELTRRCARQVLGWADDDLARQPFRPGVHTSHALRLVERLGVDFTLAMSTEPDHAVWMAWFEDAPAGTADTPGLAICRAALRYVVEKGFPASHPAASR